ncbi:hypothetical protein FM036_34105 [Nostoc sp. HG1]|nr:hypothetical protein [Nostoc sp. HG1]
MLKKIATATSAIAILVGYALPGAAQSIYNEPATTPTAAPSTEMQPTMQPSTAPSTETQPLSPSSLPTTPTPEVAPVAPETTPTTPSTEMQAPSTPAPSTETQPAVPSTSTPVTTPSAQVKPTEVTAKTTVLEEETITGIKEVSFPTPPTTPAFFTLPIELRVLKDASVTSNTPITDKNSRDLSAWASAVRACAMDKPAFVRIVGDQQVPFMINGTEGKVRMNANDKPVCSA